MPLPVVRFPFRAFLSIMMLFPITACSVSMTKPEAVKADYAFINGRIYTVDRSQPQAQALAVAGKEIAAVGSNAEIKSYISDTTRVIDLKDKMMLPGLHDMHMHMLNGGYLHTGVILNLYGPRSKQEVMLAIKDYAQTLRPGGWLLAAGVKEHEMLLHGELQAATGDRPAIVFGEKFHACWLNTAALAELGITNDIQDPEGGTFVRDGQGRLTGKLLETAVIAYGISRLTKLVPMEKNRRALKYVIDKFNRWGVTSFLEAATVAGGGEVFKSLLDQQALNGRVSLAMLHNPTLSDAENLQHLKARAFDLKPYLRSTTVKIMSDGSGGDQADMLEPYTDGSSGVAIYSQKRLNRIVSTLNDAGLQMYVHSVGDRASMQVVSAFKTARQNGHYDPALRHTLSHLDHLYPGQAEDMAKLGLYGHVSPGWATPFPLTKFIEQRVGDQRAQHMHDFRSLLDAGVTLASGSDWPAFDMYNPFVHIEGGVTRRLPGDANGEAVPGATLDVATMIDMLTINAAKMMHLDEYTGSIETGKRADLVVINQDLFNIPATDISKTRVLLTVFDGRVIHSSGELFKKVDPAD